MKTFFSIILLCSFALSSISAAAVNSIEIIYGYQLELSELLTDESRDVESEESGEDAEKDSEESEEDTDEKEYFSSQLFVYLQNQHISNIKPYFLRGDYTIFIGISIQPPEGL